MARRKSGKCSVRQTKIGFLGATTPTIWSAYVFALDCRLRELGWIDGANAVVDYQWAEGVSSRFADIAQHFVDEDVDVIVTSGTGSTLAAKAATNKKAAIKQHGGEPIPIVFAASGDPEGAGLIGSFAEPGGNVTGLANGQADFAAKRVDYLCQLVPGLSKLAIVGNTSAGNVPPDITEVESRAHYHNIETVVCDIGKATDITRAIKRLKGKFEAAYVCTDLLLTTHQVTLNVAAASIGLPTMHAFREYVEAGGLAAYGPDVPAMFVSAAELVDKILRGTHPAEIAVEEESTAELVINTGTAAAIGVKIPAKIGGTRV